jgi:hypothetical protein
MRRHYLDALFFFFLFEFTLVLNSVLLFWKLLVFEFLLGISEDFLCSLFVPHAKTGPLLHAHQLPMLFAKTLMYLEIKLLLVIFGDCP